MDEHKQNIKTVTEAKNMTICDIEQEGNCSRESEQGCIGCVHNVNEDEIKNLTD